jgi:septation ring formation regulator EzrA
MEPNLNTLTAEKIFDLLANNLSECNALVAELGKKTQLDREELRKLKNDLMFARSKARNLAKSLEDEKRPINSFKFSST